MKRIHCARTLIIILVLTLNPVSVLAQIQPQTQTKNSIGLLVSPSQYNTSINNGEQKKFDFTLLQDIGTDLNLTIQVKTFTLVNNNEDLIINEDPNELLTSWVKLNPKSITLASDQITHYSINIEIPEKIPSGSYNLAIVFAVNSKTTKHQNITSINYRIVVPVIVTVVNKVLGISEGASISKLDAIPLISLNGNTTIVAEITNSGSTHIIPRGVLEIENLWGFNFEKQSLGLNTEKKIVTSDSTRKFDTILENLPLGRYKVTLNTVYGLNNKVIAAETYFYVIPWWIILIFISIVGFIFYKIWKFKRKKITKMKLRQI